MTLNSLNQKGMGVTVSSNFETTPLWPYVLQVKRPLQTTSAEEPGYRIRQTIVILEDVHTPGRQRIVKPTSLGPKENCFK